MEREESLKVAGGLTPANDALKNNDGEGKLKVTQQIRDFVGFLVRAWGSGASQNKQRRKKERPGMDGKRKRPGNDLARPVGYRTRLTTCGEQGAAKQEIRWHCT